MKLLKNILLTFVSIAFLCIGILLRDENIDYY